MQKTQGLNRLYQRWPSMTRLVLFFLNTKETLTFFSVFKSIYYLYTFLLKGLSSDFPEN